MSTINIKKIVPSYNFIQTSSNSDIEAEGFIRDPNCPYSEFQTIEAVGPLVKNYKVGDFVKVNFNRYRKSSIPKDSLKEDLSGVQELVHYMIPSVILNNRESLIITDSDIDFVIEEYD